MSPTDGTSDARPSLDTLLRRLVELERESADSERVDIEREADIDLVLEEIQEQLTARRLSRVFEEVFVHVTEIGPRQAHGTPFVVVTLTGLNDCGDPEPLAYISGSSAPYHLVIRAFWDVVLREVERVARVLGPARIGLDDVCDTVFPDSEWVELRSGELPVWLALTGT